MHITCAVCMCIWCGRHNHNHARLTSAYNLYVYSFSAQCTIYLCMCIISQCTMHNLPVHVYTLSVHNAQSTCAQSTCACVQSFSTQCTIYLCMIDHVYKPVHEYSTSPMTDRGLSNLALSVTTNNKHYYYCHRLSKSPTLSLETASKNN